MGIDTGELVADYKRSLLDSASLFDAPSEADFLRHLRTAGRAIATGKRPRTRQATLTLEAGVALYDAPEDLLQVKASQWGVHNSCAPWDLPRTPLPILRLVDDADAGVQVQLSPAPTQTQINVFGSAYPYYYFAFYTLPDTGASDITEREKDLLILRAQIEAMRELSMRNHQKPATLRAGQGLGNAVMSKNMTPPALYEALLKEYQETP